MTPAVISLLSGVSEESVWWDGRVCHDSCPSPREHFSRFYRVEGIPVGYAVPDDVIGRRPDGWEIYLFQEEWESQI